MLRWGEMQVVYVTAHEVLQRRVRGTQSLVNRDGIGEIFEGRDLARFPWTRWTRRDAIRWKVRYVSPLIRSAIPNRPHRATLELTIPLSCHALVVRSARPFLMLPLKC